VFYLISCQDLYFIRHRNKPQEPANDAPKWEKEVYEATIDYLSPKGWKAALCLAVDIFIHNPPSNKTVITHLGPEFRLPTTLLTIRPNPHYDTEEVKQQRMFQSVLYFSRSIPVVLFRDDEITLVSEWLSNRKPNEVILMCWEGTILVDIINYFAKDDPNFKPLKPDAFDGYDNVVYRINGKWDDDKNALEQCYDDGDLLEVF